MIDFAGPYAKTPGSFAVLKKSPLAKYKSTIDLVTLNEISADEQKTIDAMRELLKGKVIGVQTTTIHSDFLDTYFKTVAEIRKYDTQENVLLDLSTGRIDAAEASLSTGSRSWPRTRGRTSPSWVRAGSEIFSDLETASVCARRIRILKRSSTGGSSRL